MKQNAGLAAIAGAVVVVGLIVFLIYKFTLAPKGPDPAAAAAEHQDMSAFYRNQGRRSGQGGGASPGAPPSR